MRDVPVDNYLSSAAGALPQRRRYSETRPHTLANLCQHCHGYAAAAAW